MELALSALALLGGIAWVSALIHVLMLLGHVRKGVTLGQLAFGGYRFFTRETFEPSGHALHRRFLWSVAAFFGVIVLGVVVAMLGAAKSA